MDLRLATSTILVETLTSQGARITQATAFFYRAANDRLHLVTNWHVITGRKLATPSMSDTGAVPCTLRCLIYQIAERGEDGTVYIRPNAPVRVDIQINSPDGEHPEWKEHPEIGLVDVVALDVHDIIDLGKFMSWPINEVPNLDPRYVPSVMDDVFIIGFPLGITGVSARGAMPIFKRGSIASEPALDYDGSPCLLVDCRSYEGMSGSPVIVSHSGMWSPPGSSLGDSFIGTVRDFLGVYSGRIASSTKDRFEGLAEIGRVWRKEAIVKVVDEGIQGRALSELI